MKAKKISNNAVDVVTEEKKEQVVPEETNPCEVKTASKEDKGKKGGLFAGVGKSFKNTLDQNKEKVKSKTKKAIQNGKDYIVDLDGKSSKEIYSQVSADVQKKMKKVFLAVSVYQGAKIACRLLLRKRAPEWFCLVKVNDRWTFK